MKMPLVNYFPRVTIEARGGYKTFDSPYGKDYLGEFSTQRLGTYSGNCNGPPPNFSLSYPISPPNLGNNRC